MNFVNYQFAHSESLPAYGPNLYEYWVGANGVFVRAERPGLKALICAAPMIEPIKGLAPLTSRVEIDRRVPANGLARILERSRRCAPTEALFYLLPDPWRLVMPAQTRSAGHVQPVDPFDEYARAALIEVHSHHNMQAYFSGTDNRDEKGFRIYGVIGKISRRPAISVRVGIYGHFQLIPASTIFELPAGMRDENFPTELEQQIDDTELIYEPIEYA